MNVRIEESDIFSIQAEAIVNPANCQGSMALGSHICEKIRKTAGHSVIEERKRLGKINLGEAVFTEGGQLPFKYIIHAAILDQFDLNPLFLLRLKQRTADHVLYAAVFNSLKTAISIPVSSLVFSPMGAGIGAMPIEKCANIMLKGIADFQKAYETNTIHTITIACKKKAAVFKTLLTKYNPLASD